MYEREEGREKQKALYQLYLCILLYVKLQQLDRCIIRTSMITDPDLQVVGRGLGEGLTEPWRVIELAAGTGGTTRLPESQK